MKGLVITHKGLEAFCGQEIQEYLPGEIEVHDGAVEFTFASWEELFSLSYQLQSALRIMVVLAEMKDAHEEVKQLEWDPRFFSGSFKVKAISEEGRELAEHIGGVIMDKTNMRANMKNPDITVVVYKSKGKHFLGIDVSDFDVSKRQHKLFGHKIATKGTVAFLLLKVAGYAREKAKETLLVDPFCGAGDVVIEAGLYASSFPVHFFEKDKFHFETMEAFKEIDVPALFEKVDEDIKKDKLKVQGYDKDFHYVAAAEKNAKIAGINKMVKISRVEIHWLDVKKDKETIDMVVTFLPSLRKELEKEREKMYKEFFYQAEFVVKKEGVMVVATEYPDVAKRFASEFKFVLDKELKVWQGKKEMTVLRFLKSKA